MHLRNFYKIFPILILLITVTSVNQWSKFPIGNTYIVWVIDFITIGMVIWYWRHYFQVKNTNDYKIVNIYLVWLLINVIRGMFVAENYWEWKQLINGSLTLSLPLLVYVFSSPIIVIRVMRFWLKYALIVFVIFIYWVLSSDALSFYLAPILLLACFLPIIKNYWRLIIIALLLIMIFADLSARSQVIKATIAFSISLSIFLAKNFTPRILRLLHNTLYILPIILLYLGVNGILNPFEVLSRNEGKFIDKKIIDGEKTIEDLSADTRTFIYVEVIKSAIKHNYWLWGRTPSRGNDSMSFGTYSAEELKTGKYERHSNELCFLNVFTWLGLIGMVLYGLIYLRSSYLAVFKSNNIYIKVLGIFIAFRFAYGWIEDFNRFDIMNISLWLLISLGLSEQFRKMNDKEFRYWLNKVF